MFIRVTTNYKIQISNLKKKIKAPLINLIVGVSGSRDLKIYIEVMNLIKLIL